VVSGQHFLHVVRWGSPSFTFTFNKKNIFILWSETLSYDLDLTAQPKQSQGEHRDKYPCQRTLCLMVIMQTHTQTTVIAALQSGR